MTKPTLIDTLHEASHRVPGVPEHIERSSGHHGSANHGHSARTTDAARPAPRRNRVHSPARPPRMLVAWQRRIAALFGQKL